MSILTSPDGTSCGRCGRTPALGYAQVDDTWLCHPDEDDRPDCYSLWQWDQLQGDIYAARIGEHLPRVEVFQRLREQSEGAPRIEIKRKEA